MKEQIAILNEYQHVMRLFKLFVREPPRYYFMVQSTNSTSGGDEWTGKIAAIKEEINRNYS